MFTNEHDNNFWDITKQCLIGLYFRNIFGCYDMIGGLVSLWSRGFIFMQSRKPKLLLSNSKAVNACEDKCASFKIKRKKTLC